MDYRRQIRSYGSAYDPQGAGQCNAQFKKGRVIIQNRYFDKTENREMLLRVIGLETSDEFKVITLYKTSKIKKYWIGGG